MSRLTPLAIIAALGTACFQADVSADDVGAGEQPPIELFLDASTAPVCDGPDPSTLTALAIEVRTAAVGGRFRPRNVGAIWIEDAEGAFVKTVELWGTTRTRYLTAFQASADGDDTDAVTGATLQTHQTHTVTWDLTDRSRCEVANGSYALRLEITDRNGAGATLAVPFDKDGTAATILPEGSSNFLDLSMTLE